MMYSFILPLTLRETQFVQVVEEEVVLEVAQEVVALLLVSHLL